MRAIFLVTLAVTAAGPLRAQRDSGTVAIPGFRFASGETLPGLHLFYRTLGKPRRDAAGVVRNAVLILHGTGGTGAQFFASSFVELYGPGAALDTSANYIILPDDVGHGRSSKPSDGPHARFPHYGYPDMVALEFPTSWTALCRWRARRRRSPGATA